MFAKLSKTPLRVLCGSAKTLRFKLIFIAEFKQIRRGRKVEHIRK